MDEIDFNELVEALQELVNVYYEENAPYAISTLPKTLRSLSQTCFNKRNWQ